MVTCPPTYQADGRRALADLYSAFFKLSEKYGWQTEVLYEEQFSYRRRDYSLPILAFCTPKKGPTLWLLAGIHGEEPAGPNALALSIKFLAKLGQKIPLVVSPLLNPRGYFRNWRYPERRLRPRSHTKEVISDLHDSEYLLPDLADLEHPRWQNRRPHPRALAVTGWAVATVKKYPPRLVLDLHEDKSQTDPYLYVYSAVGANDPAAREVARIIGRCGLHLKEQGTVWNSGRRVPVQDGLAVNITDGSIDELLAAPKIFIDGKKTAGPGAKTVIVVETRALGVSLVKRVRVHCAIIRSLARLWPLTLPRF